MRIVLNDEEESFPGNGTAFSQGADSGGEALSVRAILDIKHWSFPLIIARLNGELVPREAYSETMVKEGDRLELYHLVSGG